MVPLEKSKERWTEFLLQMLDGEASVDEYGSVVRLMIAKFPIASVDLCRIVFLEPSLLSEALDPALPNFIKELLYCDAISVQDALLFLLERRKVSRQGEEDHHSSGSQSRISAACSLLEYAVFNFVEKKVTPQLYHGLILFDLFDVAHALNDWMSFLIDQQTSFMIYTGTPDEHDLAQNSSFARETLASLLACLIENDQVARWIGMSGKSEYGGSCAFLS